MKYQLTFVHPVVGVCPDATCEVELDEHTLNSRTELAAQLRAARVLVKHQRILGLRRDIIRDCVVVFPSRTPGGWHSITLKEVF